MTDKQTPVDHTGFQITREFLKIPATVTAQSLGIHVGGLAGGFVNKFDFDPIINRIIEILNDLDLNDDHKSDVAEIAPLVIKFIPIAVEIAPLVNIDAVKSDVLALPAKFPHYFKDAASATAKLTSIFALIEEGAAKLATTK